MMERLQSLPPDQRERALEQMRARGFDPTAGDTAANQAGGNQSRARGRPAAANAQPAPAASNAQPATTIDALFGPLPTVESAGRVWLYIDKQLKSVRVRLGITDGQATELLEGDIEPGQELVTNVVTGSEPTRAAPTGFPFGGQQRFPAPGGGGGGNRGGGGGNRGGGRGD